MVPFEQGQGRWREYLNALSARAYGTLLCRTAELPFRAPITDTFLALGNAAGRRLTIRRG